MRHAKGSFQTNIELPRIESGCRPGLPIVSNVNPSQRGGGY